MVTGLFRDRDSVERAYQSASSRGYGTDDVDLIMSDETRTRHFSHVRGTETELGTKAAEGAGTAVRSAVRWARLPQQLLRSAPRSLFQDWAGNCRPACGAGAGAATGGLVGWGIPEERVKQYEAGIKDGGILMGVKARSDDDAKTLGGEWKQHRGEDVYW